MVRTLKEREFRAAFQQRVVNGHFNELPEYYPRYRSRYRRLLDLYASLAPPRPCDVLDVGGGQCAALIKELWNDQAMVADIGGSHLEYVESLGIGTKRWDLCSDDQPFDRDFDVVIFSEVIEHLPIPAHVVLAHLQKCLKPGGVLICTTPNLYRLRNVVYLACGVRIFDFFRMPEGEGLGHVIEFSKQHLEWQLQRAGFTDVDVAFEQFHHHPHQLAPRLLSWAFYPLFLVPRWRDNLVAIARTAQNPDEESNSRFPEQVRTEATACLVEARR